MEPSSGSLVVTALLNSCLISSSRWMWRSWTAVSEDNSTTGSHFGRTTPKLLLSLCPTFSNFIWIALALHVQVLQANCHNNFYQRQDFNFLIKYFKNLALSFLDGLGTFLNCSFLNSGKLDTGYEQTLSDNMRDSLNSTVLGIYCYCPSGGVVVLQAWSSLDQCTAILRIWFFLSSVGK